MSNKVSTYNSYTHYKHHISQYIYIYIFLTISTYLKNISNTLLRTHYKISFLWKIYIYNAKSLSYEMQKLIKLKVLLMEGNITHTCLKNQKSITWKKSFKCTIKMINLTNLYTRLDIFSLPLVALIFPFQT